MYRQNFLIILGKYSFKGMFLWKKKPINIILNSRYHILKYCFKEMLFFSEITFFVCSIIFFTKWQITLSKLLLLFFFYFMYLNLPKYLDTFKVSKSFQHDYLQHPFLAMHLETRSWILSWSTPGLCNIFYLFFASKSG